jgi:hypothetical protein
MFTQPETKLDLFAEMNAGKVICINTAKSLLQPKGCEAFGRFFLALIVMAAQRRAPMPEKEKKPCHVFIDEVEDYASDANISTIIEQCRKQKVALTVAHQNTSQLSQRVIDSFQTVAIKCASSLTNRDAHVLAPGMRCKPDMLTDQPRGTFAVYVRNLTPTAVTTSVPFGVLEDMERMSDSEYEAMHQTMRAKYARTQQPPHEEAVAAAPKRVIDRTTTIPQDEYGFPEQQQPPIEKRAVSPPAGGDTASVPDENVLGIVQKKRRRKKRANLDEMDTSTSKTL